MENQRNTSEDLFDQLLEMLTTRLRKHEERETLELLVSNAKNFFSKTSESYRSSQECRTILEKTLQQLSSMGGQTDVKPFSLLLPIFNEFKAHKMQNPSQYIVPVSLAASLAASFASSPTVASSAHFPDENSVPFGGNTSKMAVNPMRSFEDNRRQLDRKRKQRDRCFKRYSMLKNTIEEGGLKDFTMDEMESDEYEDHMRNLHRLQAEIVKTEKELRMLDEDEKIETYGRPTDAMLTFKGSGYPNIDATLTALINEPKIKMLKPGSIERMIYPISSYNIPSKEEVEEIVKKENQVGEGLGLNQEQLNKLVRQIVNDVVAVIKKNTVKERRQVVDDWNFSKNSENLDPAAGDAILEKKLAENKIARKRELETFFASVYENSIALPDLIRKELASEAKSNVHGVSKSENLEECLSAENPKRVDVSNRVSSIKAQEDFKRNGEAKVQKDETEESVKSALMALNVDKLANKKAKQMSNEDAILQTFDFGDDPSNLRFDN